MAGKGSSSGFKGRAKLGLIETVEKNKNSIDITYPPDY